MNTFTSKKLGEVLAFSKCGIDTFEKGHSALSEVLSSDLVDSTIRALETHVRAIENIVEKSGIAEITLPKSEGTISKLNNMRDAYVGEEWHNPAELMEWLGFFEGSAIVHWNLVLGAAETLEKDELRELSTDNISLHQNLFDAVISAIRNYAAKTASI